MNHSCKEQSSPSVKPISIYNLKSCKDKSPNFARNQKESKKERMARLMKELSQLIQDVANKES